MTRDDIIRMAREAGFSEWAVRTPQDLERFAALVAAAERDRREFELAECYRCGWDGGVKTEREACVSKIQAEIYHAITNGTRLSARSWGELAVPVSNLEAAIDAIRARGNK